MAIKIQQTSLHHMLASPTRMIESSENVLTYLFRSVLVSRGITLFLWNKRHRDYFNRGDDRDANKDRGNLNKQLAAPDFTWSAFKRAIDFLRPRSALLTVIVSWKDGSVSEYSVAIDPNEKEDDIIENEHVEFLNVVDNTPPSTLARLFRTIAVDRKAEDHWDQLLQEYVEQGPGGDTNTTLAKERNGIDRLLRNPRITLTGFRRGMILLQADHIEYQLELQWKPGDISIHTAKPEGC